MTDARLNIAHTFLRLGRLRDLLDLLADIQQMREPLTTPGGLRQALELLARLAELIGIDLQWIERVQAVLADERVFNIVLAVMQYVLFSLWEDAEATVFDFSGESCGIDAQSFSEWLPLVLELLAFWRFLRGA